MRSRLKVVGAAVVSLFVGSCTALNTTTVYSPPGTTTTLFIVRHAERDPGLDPPLNEEGLARAQILADELGDEGITAVYYPALIRNRQTAEPLVEQVNPSVKEYSALEVADTRALANRLIEDILRDHAGGVALWIGNTGPETPTQSGNLQELWNRLGGPGDPPIRYRDLYKVVLYDDREPEFVMGSYGPVSSLD
ncbi:MAG: histidine phosphatase family protein [Phycisphaerae bacterium]|nr:histidine phosphatase family protein [Phycisphaerae bacterium]